MFANMRTRNKGLMCKPISRGTHEPLALNINYHRTKKTNPKYITATSQYNLIYGYGNTLHLPGP